jgi:hypothetical protein
MRFFVVALLAVLTVRAGSVAELVAAVRSGLAAKRGDAEIAASVQSTRLTERLDDAAIEQLESEGAGPRTVEQLEWLREDSGELPAPAALPLFDAPPGLSAEEQALLLGKARAAALAYTANLPNFLCTESVQRHGRVNGKPWRLHDSFTVDVSYSTAKGEAYKLLTINGKPTRKSLKDVGGFQSDGEFGSLLREVFRPQSAARIQWERWGNLRGRRVAVFTYHIDRRRSHYQVAANGGLFRRYRLTTGMTGRVYIDPDSARTMRFSAGDDGLPAQWPIRETSSVVDYDFAEVAGESFLLPKRVAWRIVLPDGQRRNVMEFGNYRRFSSDTTVTFEKQ